MEVPVHGGEGEDTVEAENAVAGDEVALQRAEEHLVTQVPLDE